MSEETKISVVKRIKETIKKFFELTITALLCFGFLLIYFGWQAYNGKTTPFETVYLMKLNDDISHANNMLQLIEDTGVLPTVDALRVKVAKLEKQIKEK